MTGKTEKELFYKLKKAWGCVGYAEKVIYLPLKKHQSPSLMTAVKQLVDSGWHTIEQNGEL
jgi:hypothetical protein